MIELKVMRNVHTSRMQDLRTFRERADLRNNFQEQPVYHVILNIFEIKCLEWYSEL